MLNNNEIDNNLYDRQIRTFGYEAVKKISTSSILIYGLEQGLGTEVAKNLSLCGIKNIYLCDNNNVNSNDLETGYYYTTNDINLTRSNVLVNNIQELNPYVSVHSVIDYKQNQNVTIVINQDTQIVDEISDYCRNNNSSLVVLYSKGLSGILFIDAGINHLVNDVRGENIEPIQIYDINNKGIVTCCNPHDFQTNDVITFVSLEGKNIELLENEWTINIIDKFKFQLNDFNIDNLEFINGTCIYINKPIHITHESWNIQKNNPTINFSFDIDESVSLIGTYLQMFSNKLIDKMPFIWDNEIDKFMEINNIKNKKHAKTFNFEFIPIVSIMGSITASEAIKLVSNKYLPATQWFTWCDNKLIPKQKEYLNSKTKYGIFWGNEFENKLVNSNWLLVGCGAIGCEHLKNLAFMNVANNKYGNGQIITTDPDIIEKSNLNRQFLFRNNHIGKSKSETSALIIKNMKENINIKAFTEKVGNENTEFIEKVLNFNLNGVLNALDNISARKYMDEICFKYNIPLFESGTTGTKGNTQPVIPFITETYSNSSDPETEKSFPMCTIKSFPNDIVHTIHWAMDQFEFFNRAPLNMNNWINNSKYIDNLSPNEKTIALSDINKLTIKYPTQINGITTCVQFAIDMFIFNYYSSINELLKTNPPDLETEPGIKFWSKGKKCPKPIQFDINNPLHFDYINSTTHLLLRISGLNDDYSNQEIFDILQNCNINYEYNDNDIIGKSNDFKSIYVPQEFEKDDDTNWHIEWINCASNLRAINYNIQPATKLQTKGIAGKIIPAIATTTSIVSGLILLEMIKYLLDFDKLEDYSSCFVNLAHSLLISTEPIQSPTIKIGNKELNSWYKFEYKNDTFLKEFKEYYDNMFNTNITMIVADATIIYCDMFMELEDIKLSDAIKKAMEIDYVPSNLSISLSSNDEIEFPSIIINI